MLRQKMQYKLVISLTVQSLLILIHSDSVTFKKAEFRSDDYLGEMGIDPDRVVNVNNKDGEGLFGWYWHG